MSAPLPSPSAPTGDTLHLSLISHTNAGKTTLARTLLGHDVGEVRDAAHVTQAAEGHVLLATAEGDRLLLWDTPGFGDSERLARRLALAGNPLGWLMTEVWDRFSDRPFWLAQRALRHAFEATDVVLYLVNASEAPADVAWLDAELKVLALVNKPVIVLLNQLGPPLTPDAEATELARWRTRVAASGAVRELLALDAFARCWVQEDGLLRAVAQALPAPRQAAMARLQQAWLAQGVARWHDAMHALAQALHSAAADQQTLADSASWGQRLRQVGGALSGAVGGLLGSVLGRDTATPAATAADINPALEAAQAALAQRLDTGLQLATDRLLRLHRLGGEAGAAVRQRVQSAYAMAAPVDAGHAAVWGGLVAGAATGLGADVAAGGLSLGAGTLVGAVLGALGAVGLAQGVNLVRGVDRAAVRWSDAALDEATHTALLTYLAVAHYGRGRGDYSATEHPPHWAEAVRQALAPHQATLHTLWEQQRTPDHPEAAHSTTPSAAVPPTADVAPLARLLCAASATLLHGLYPHCAPLDQQAQSGPSATRAH